MATTHILLERLYGFAVPADGRDELIRAFCDAPASAEHAADCAYWDARVAFASPAARRLAAQLTSGTL